jgi:hypothetical protein
LLQKGEPDSAKRRAAVSWTAGEHPLATDFRLQDMLDKAENREAFYELVVSTDELRVVMEESRPSDLSGVDVTVFRGAGDDLLGLLGRQPELVEALDRISLRQPQDIVREQTFQAILGAWVHSGGKGRLKDILATIAARPDALVRVPGPDYELPAAVVEALQRVPGLRWRISGMHLSYEVGRLKGWAAYPCGSKMFREFERFLTDSGTKHWMDVVSALRREG